MDKSITVCLYPVAYVSPGTTCNLLTGENPVAPRLAGCRLQESHFWTPFVDFEIVARPVRPGVYVLIDTSIINGVFSVEVNRRRLRKRGGRGHEALST